MLVAGSLNLAGQTSSAQEAEVQQSLASGPYAAFTRIASDATYGCRRPHGYGVYDPVADKTFVCWNGPGMSVMGRSYDHATGSWSPEKEICKLDYYGTWDYHNYPNMVLAPDGHLLITWADHTENLQLARSPEPHSMEGEWSHEVIDEGLNCYPMMIVAGERVYIFFSIAADKKWPQRSFGYIYSDDSGKVWTNQQLGIDSQKLDPDRIDEVYAFHYAVSPATDEQPERISLVWVMRGGPNGHNIGSRNAYYAVFLPESGTWQSVDGTDLGRMIDLEEMEAHCAFLDTGPQPDHQQVTRILTSWYADGTPFVFYDTPQGCWQATWRDGQWQHENMWNLNGKDLELMPDGSHRMLLAPPGQKSVLIYEQAAKGEAWVKTFESEIPYDNGADRTWSMGFLDHSRPEVDVLMSQLKRGEEKKDYTGSWPVWTMSSQAETTAR